MFGWRSGGVKREPWHHRRAVSPPPIELLLAKIGLSAGIVIGVTLAAERLGPRLGGLIAVDLAYLLALNWSWIRGGAR